MPLSLWAWDTWLTGSVEEAELQRPLPAARLQIVETNVRADAVG
jgi:putative SOS response-associated peptidase YedK